MAITVFVTFFVVEIATKNIYLLTFIVPFVPNKVAEFFPPWNSVLYTKTAFPPFL